VLTFLIPAILVLGAIAYGIYAYVSNNQAEKTATSISSQIAKPVDDASEAALKQDIQNEVISVQSYLATSGATSLSDLPPAQGSSGNLLTVSGTVDAYTITGVSTKGLRLVYSSATQQITAG
jgi:hypothetical protein